MPAATALASISFLRVVVVCSVGANAIHEHLRVDREGDVVASSRLLRFVRPVVLLEFDCEIFAAVVLDQGQLDEAATQRSIAAFQSKNE